MVDEVVAELAYSKNKDIEKFYKLSKQGFPDVEPEIDTGLFMSALRTIDGRTWHDREVDYLTQFSESKLGREGYDLLLRDVDIAHSDHNYNKGRPETRGKSNLVDQNLPIVDLDFALVSFSSEKALLDYWDVKTDGIDLKASDLCDKVDRIADVLETGGYNVDTTMHRLTASELPSKLEEIDSEPLPDKYDGDYIFSDHLDQDRPEVKRFVNQFMGYDSFEELEKIEKVKRSEDFFS